MNICNCTLKNQTDFQDKIRRACRVAVSRYGGIRRFANAIGEDEGRWTNRLTDGRVVGFDVDWLYTVFIVTHDAEVLLPFFMHKRTDRFSTLMNIARKLNYHAFMFPRFRVEEKKISDDTKYEIVGRLLQAAERIIK